MGERRSGTLTQWNDERGFGFITGADSSKSVFVHISEFEPGAPRPLVGDVVDFETVLDAANRPQAVSVRGFRRSVRTPRPAGPASYIVLAAFVALFIAVDIRWPLPAWVYVVYVGVSLLTYLAYARDKRAAIRGRWRTPEAQLLLMGFLGGWPGAVVAQLTLRHKTRKASFRLAFWITVFLNVIVFVLLSTQVVARLVAGG